MTSRRARGVGPGLPGWGCGRPAATWAATRASALVTTLAALVVAGCVTRRVRDPGPPTVILLPAPRAADTAAAAPPPGIPRDTAPAAPTDATMDVRVGLATAAQDAPLTATGPWRLYDASGDVLIRGRAGETWTVEHDGQRLRARSRAGQGTQWVTGDVTLRTDIAGTYGTFAGRRYRGALRVVATDTGLIVVNVLAVEEYLRGVVPLEIGVSRSESDQAAVEAQAVAARSYTWVRLSATTGGGAPYDLVATVNDQVYGGVDAERENTDRAVRATAGLVLKYSGRVVDAPYSSACGGETATPDEVWRTGATPGYLRRVSDRIPGTTDRYYCDIAPRFSWTKEFSSAQLDAAVRAYLGSYAGGVPAGGPGHVRAVSVVSRTPSGRVATTSFATDRGSFSVRGNDVRYVLRAVGGEILNSTYFSVANEPPSGGSLSRIVIRGNGYGHGVGMCQWGAIGRARAGQTARAILAAYYPGTSVGFASQ
ncbi:MAG: SpoIID/LytB domain-containing protein [Gemmatimonadota bacterium]|nr:SpoIID/LytB domain-containing protein [Gemmatimonadota bacterium]